MAETAPHDEYLENGRFTVEIPGCEQESADVVTVSIDPMRVRVLDVTHGDMWDYRRLKPGHTEYGEARFQFRVADESYCNNLKQWQEDCRKGVKDKTRKNISVMLHDRAGGEARRYNLIDCFCTYFSHGDYSTDSTANLAEMHCRIGHVEFAQ